MIIKTKYAPDDKVWYISEDSIMQGEINRISIQIITKTRIELYYELCGNNHTYSPSELFKTINGAQKEYNRKIDSELQKMESCKKQIEKKKMVVKNV